MRFENRHSAPTVYRFNSNRRHKTSPVRQLDRLRASWTVTRAARRRSAAQRRTSGAAASNPSRGANKMRFESRHSAPTVYRLNSNRRHKTSPVRQLDRLRASWTVTRAARRRSAAQRRTSGAAASNPSRGANKMRFENRHSAPTVYRFNSNRRHKTSPVRQLDRLRASWTVTRAARRRSAAQRRTSGAAASNPSRGANTSESCVTTLMLFRPIPYPTANRF
jgi:hypothetical protein